MTLKAENREKRQERNVSLDVLRIIVMLMIIMHHCFGNSGGGDYFKPELPIGQLLWGAFDLAVS